MSRAGSAGQISARGVAAEALGRAAEHFPDLYPNVEKDKEKGRPGALSAVDARLALAIQRVAMQRWLTLEYLLDLRLRQPMHRLEPRLQGLLLSGAAQLVGLERVPAHAVVDESVRLARATIRPGAAGLVNAVLRGMCGLLGDRRLGSAWVAAADALPVDGGVLGLSGDVLPDAGMDYAWNLGIATSHPRALVEEWLQAYGRDQALEIGLHGVLTPPTVVAVEPGWGGEASTDWARHELEGFCVWRGTRAALMQFLSGHPARRVQDPTAAKALLAVRDMICGREPSVVVDYCAGMGTKTRQAAALFPDAEVVAHEPNPARRGALVESFGSLDSVRVVEARGAGVCHAGAADVLLLDVPCTNTGVLGRRPEARYRYGPESLGALVDLQRRIVDEAVGLLGPGGTLVYSTCSLEHTENERQASWIARRHGLRVVLEKATFPGGEGVGYHDGGYFAVLGGGDT